MGLLTGLSKFFGAVFTFISAYIKEVVLMAIGIFIAGVLTSWYWSAEVEQMKKDNKELIARIEESNKKLLGLEEDSKKAADTAETEAITLKAKLSDVHEAYNKLKAQDKRKSKPVTIRVPAVEAPKGKSGTAGSGSGSGSGSVQAPALGTDSGSDSGSGTERKRPFRTEDGDQKLRLKSSMMVDIPVYLTENNEVQCERFFASFATTINEYVVAANGVKPKEK